MIRCASSRVPHLHAPAVDTNEFWPNTSIKAVYCSRCGVYMPAETQPLTDREFMLFLKFSMRIVSTLQDIPRRADIAVQNAADDSAIPLNKEDYDKLVRIVRNSDLFSQKD